MSPTVLHTTWQILGSWQKEVLDAQICARIRLPIGVSCAADSSRASPSSFSRASPRCPSRARLILRPALPHHHRQRRPDQPLQHAAERHSTAQCGGGVRVRLRFHQEGVRDGTGHRDAAAAIHSTNGRPADAQVPTSLNRFLPFLVF